MSRGGAFLRVLVVIPLLTGTGLMVVLVGAALLDPGPVLAGYLLDTLFVAGLGFAYGAVLGLVVALPLATLVALLVPPRRGPRREPAREKMYR